MVTGAGGVEGGHQVISAGVRKTIQSIKEIVGNHSETDIYVTLKETNMDPDETAQKLLNLDTFHEVRRKRREKRKEVQVLKGSTALQPNHRTEHSNQGMRPNSYSNHIFRRAGYRRNALPDEKVSREFWVVKDNRINQNSKSEIKPPSEHSPISTTETKVSKVSEKSSVGSSKNQKPPVGRQPSHSSTVIAERPRHASGAQLDERKDLVDERGGLVLDAGSPVRSLKPNDSQPNSTTSSNNTAGGVYSSSSDPVHVPSPDSRPGSNVGAIKREVGVRVRRQSIEKPVKLFNSHLGHDGPSREKVKSDISRGAQLSQTPFSESAKPNTAATRPFVSAQYNSSRQHQPVGHHKASQSNREWKPKSSKKQSSTGPGIIGTPAKSASPHDGPKDLEKEAVQVQDKLSLANISEKQNVFIAAHIRVPEADRYHLTFGSLGTGLKCTLDPEFQAIEAAEESFVESPSSLSNSPGETSSDETSGGKEGERVQNSGSDSLGSGAVSEQLVDRKESSSHELENYADIGLVRDNAPSYTPAQSQQQQNPPHLPNFSAYDAQTVYDPYFRPTVDETARGIGLQYPQEALSSLAANSIPASTVSTVQQQQPPQIGQMYPQVHYANLMPYRQFISPVYVPPMAVPGYSNNPAYAHPSNGNNYLLMPGAASGIKYGIQPFKPVPGASPTGFGNYTSPTGYPVNAPGVGSATGIEDLSRLKYKDGNIYVPNPQGETSDMWMNPRDVSSLQSASYYNMTGQTAHAAAYLPSHTGHTSFNAAQQSSHMQFPGMYLPPQPAAVPSTHHLGHAMGSNIGVGVGVGAGAPGPQVGAYQQPQLGHLNWTGNF